MEDYKKLIDFNIDYYEVMEVSQYKDLPKKDFLNYLDKKFKELARVKHPDYGGSEEEFFKLLKAKRVLEDSTLKKIYDSGDFSILENNLDINLDLLKIGGYNESSLAANIGNNLFNFLNENKEYFNIRPIFCPRHSYDSYEWRFLHNLTQEEICLTITFEDEEILKLSSNKKTDDTIFDFRISIFIPQKQASFKKNKDDVNTAIFCDNIIVEFSTLEYLKSIFNNKEFLFSNLEAKLNKGFNINNVNQIGLNESEMKKYDQAKLDEVLAFKNVKVDYNEAAADFIEGISKRG